VFQATKDKPCTSSVPTASQIMQTYLKPSVFKKWWKIFSSHITSNNCCSNKCQYFHFPKQNQTN
jgi:hypothetical protein